MPPKKKKQTWVDIANYKEEGIEKQVRLFHINNDPRNVELHHYYFF